MLYNKTSLSPREEKITRETYFKLVSKKDQELNELISVAQKLTHLLRFVTNETVSLDSMSAISDSHVENAGGSHNTDRDKHLQSKWVLP